MTSPLVRSIVETLGERGQIALPLVEQLLPVITVEDLDRLGAPPWVPWVGFFALGAVAAQRSAVSFLGDPSRILVVESIQSANNNANIGARNPSPAGYAPNTGVYATDFRQWPISVPAVIRCAAVTTNTVANITGSYTSDIWRLRAENDYRLEHPWYLTAEGQELIIFHDSDNTDLSVWVKGRALVRQ